jgi:hypothetical protein
MSPCPSGESSAVAEAVEFFPHFVDALAIPVTAVPETAVLKSW